jgi:hypothetical protein
VADKPIPLAATVGLITPNPYDEIFVGAFQLLSPYMLLELTDRGRIQPRLCRCRSSPSADYWRVASISDSTSHPA